MTVTSVSFVSAETPFVPCASSPVSWVGPSVASSCSARGSSPVGSSPVVVAGRTLVGSPTGLEQQLPRPGVAGPERHLVGAWSRRDLVRDVVADLDPVRTGQLDPVAGPAPYRVLEDTDLDRVADGGRCAERRDADRAAPGVGRPRREARAAVADRGLRARRGPEQPVEQRDGRPRVAHGDVRDGVVGVPEDQGLGVELDRVDPAQFAVGDPDQWLDRVRDVAAVLRCRGRCHAPRREGIGPDRAGREGEHGSAEREQSAGSHQSTVRPGAGQDDRCYRIAARSSRVRDLGDVSRTRRGGHPAGRTAVPRCVPSRP